MRKLLRSMAKAKMKQMGNGRWRELVGAYPLSLVTGAPMSKGFHGKKKYKPGHYSHLFAY